MTRRRWLGRAFLLVSLSAGVAEAHLTLSQPPARHPADDLKDGPCGIGSIDQRTSDPSKITTYQPGETVTITWTEVVDHDPSHYRIAFSAAGDAFEDPTAFDDIRTGYPILLDGIADADAGPGHEYSVQVTLPSQPCDACTLQVIQVMHDKPPWGPEGGDDIYYQCADIVIEDDGSPADPSPGGAPGTMSGTGGVTVVGTGGSSTAPPVGGSGDDSPMNGSSDSSNSSESGGCSFNSLHNPASPGWILSWVALALWLRRKTNPGAMIAT